MTKPTETPAPIPLLNMAIPDAPRRPSFITPEMIEKNPALAAAGLFAGDPLFDELVKEIKKERERQRRRERRQETK